MRARIVAVSVEVQCPKCGEPQPDPERGSFIWEAYQFPAPDRKCVSCGVALSVRLPKQVSPE